MILRQYKGPMKTSGKLFSRRIPSFIGAYRCFINLPFETLSKFALKEKLDEIGRTK